MVLGQSGWRGEVEDNWKVEGDGGQLEGRRRWRTSVETLQLKVMLTLLGNQSTAALSLKVCTVQ